MQVIHKDETLTEYQLIALVWAITGHLYTFATVSDRKWGEEGPDEKGPFYQLMPDTLEGMEFFHWYCDNRMYKQFFATKENCVVNFLFYWRKWKDEKKKLQEN